MWMEFRLSQLLEHPSRFRRPLLPLTAEQFDNLRQLLAAEGMLE